MRSLLQQGRSLEEVDLQVKKWATETSATGGKGRWVTKQYLKDECHYDQLLVCIHKHDHIAFNNLFLLDFCWVLNKGNDRQ